MKFDWTLNFGHVLTAGTMLTAIILSYGNLSKAIALIELRLATAETSISLMANQNTRITVLERVVNELPDKMDDVILAIRQIQSEVAP